MMEPVRFPAGVLLSENSAQAAASRCSASGAAIVRQPLPECDTSTLKAGQKEAEEVLSAMMLKEEIIKANNMVMRYITQGQELEAVMKCLEETRRAKDDECRRHELELKKTTDALHAAVKATNEREAANARLVEINYRLNEKLNRSEASIPDFARVVKERDVEIAQLKAEKASAEQAYRAKLKLVKRREKRGKKEANRNSKEVEKLLKQQKEDHAVMKVLYEQLESKNKELRESKRLVARMSKQLENYKTKLKFSRGRQYVFSDEESEHSLNGENVTNEDFADATVISATTGFTSSGAFTSSPVLSAELTSRTLIGDRITAARLTQCGHAGRNRRTDDESSISDVTMSDFTMADSGSDDEGSFIQSNSRVEKQMSTAVTAERGETSPSEMPEANQAPAGDLGTMCSTAPRGKRVMLKPGQVDKRHTASIEAAADSDERSSDRPLCCDCDRCSELTMWNRPMGNVDDDDAVTGKVRAPTAVSDAAIEPDGLKSYCLPSLFNTAVSGRAASVEPSDDLETITPVTSNVFNEYQYHNTPTSSRSTLPVSRRRTPAAKGHAIVSESTRVRRSSSAATAAKSPRSRTKKTKAGTSVRATASSSSCDVMDCSSHSDISKSSNNDMHENEGPSTGSVAGEPRSLISKASMTLKIKPCSVRLIDVLAGRNMPKATGSFVALSGPAAATPSASESNDRLAAWTSAAHLSPGCVTCEIACEPNSPLVLNPPAVSWAMTATSYTTMTTSFSQPLAATSIAAISNVTAVTTDATAAAQKPATAASPAACTRLSHVLDDDEDATANCDIVAALCTTASVTSVVTALSAIPAVVAIRAAPSEPPLTEIVARPAASSFEVAKVISTSSQEARLGCHCVSCNTASLFDLPELCCQTMLPETAYSSRACSTLGQVSTVLHESLRAGQCRDGLYSAATNKLSASQLTLSLADQSSGEKLAQSEPLTGCSDRLASPANDVNLVRASRASSKPEFSGAPPPLNNVGCPSNQEDVTCKLLEDERARHAHAELRGGHQVPMSTEHERDEAGTYLSGSIDDDDRSGHVDYPGSSEGGSQNALLAANEHDQHHTTAGSCFSGRGNSSLDEPGHFQGLHGCTSADSAAATLPRLHPSVGENEAAVCPPAASVVLQMPEGNEKNCISSDETNRNEEAGASLPLALPDVEQAHYAARELRSYVLDTSGYIAVRELVENLSEVVRHPRALLEGVIKVLSESQEDLIAVVSAKCDLGAYSTPTHTESELKMLTLLQIASQSMANLYQSAIDMLAAAIIHSSFNVNQLGRCAVCRIFTSLCKATDDRARVRSIISDVLTLELPSFPVLIVAVASCWPDVLRCTAVEDMHLKLYERIVMQKLKADACVDVASKEMLAILRTLCNWSTEAVDPTALCSRLISDIARPACPEDSRRLLRLLQLLTAHEPWPWIKSSLINKLIWPLLQCWAESTIGRQPENGRVGDVIACDLIVFLGSLCLHHCPQHDQCEVNFVAELMSVLLEILIISMTDVSENNQPSQFLDIPWFVQVSTFNVLLSLARYGPELVAEAIRQWVTPNQSRIEQCIMDEVRDFLQRYPGAVSDGSR